jgi:hypothetical protein
MEYMKIGKIFENDIDCIIAESGGQRLSDDSSRETDNNADYLFFDSIIELKIIEEEGLAKNERQKKLAELFKNSLSSKPTIVLDPFQLSSEDQNKYYKIMSTPIKTAIKKATKQLKKSKEKLNDIQSCGLIIINDGYGALSHEEFKEIVLKRVTQDTRSIDFLIIGGIYFFSDVIDNYTLAPFEMISLNIANTPNNLCKIKTAWNNFLDKFMTSMINGYDDRVPNKLPIIDFEYEIDNVRYVKQAPKIGKESKFYPNGRPRDNSTGIKKCPPLARTFPKIKYDDWLEFKKLLTDSFYLKETYSDWLSFQQRETSCSDSPLQPFICLRVQPEEFINWSQNNTMELTFQSLCLHVNDLFEEKVRKLSNPISINNALDVPEYVLFVIEEIGQDEANDYGSIIHVTNNFYEKKEITLIENEPMFFELGLAFATAYAVKLELSAVFYQRNRKYVWE